VYDGVYITFFCSAEESNIYNREKRKTDKQIVEKKYKKEFIK